MARPIVPLTGNTKFRVSVSGADQLKEMLQSMQDDFGDKATSKVIIEASKKALKPALEKAKQIAPKDSGELAMSLVIEGRKPNRRDKRSKYVSPTDVVTAFITTAPKSKLIKNRKKRLKAIAKKKGVKFDQTAFDNAIQKFDARAIAQEFGTAKQPGGQPYLRPALEVSSVAIIKTLAEELRNAIRKYRYKHS